MVYRPTLRASTVRTACAVVSGSPRPRGYGADQPDAASHRGKGVQHGECVTRGIAGAQGVDAGLVRLPDQIQHILWRTSMDIQADAYAWKTAAHVLFFYTFPRRPKSASGQRVSPRWRVSWMRWMFL
jgi:hypothetical protein